MGYRCGPGVLCDRFRRDVVTAHSDKTGAPTGFHPLLAFLDGTGEALAGILRPGNGGSNTAADHIRVLDRTLTQPPIDPDDVEVIASADSTGLTHEVIAACVTANVRFSVDHDPTETIRTTCLAIPERAGVPAITADGIDFRDDADSPRSPPWST